MTPPTFVAAGTGVGSVDAITPGMPSGVLTNDILLAFFETANQAITLSGGTETWAETADSPQSQGTGGLSDGGRCTCFWARASQDSPTSPTTNDSGNHQYGRIIAVRGCIESGNPWDVTVGGVLGTSTNHSLTGDETTVADCLVVIGYAWSLDNAGPIVTSFTNGDLANLTERVDEGTIEGNGGGIAIATGEKASAGTFGNTALVVTATEAEFIILALKPAAEEPTVPTTIPRVGVGRRAGS